MQSVLDGFNGTIFAYGQTGTGKTFTMQGILVTISAVHRTWAQFTHTVNVSVFSYRLKMGSMQSGGTVTHNVKRSKVSLIKTVRLIVHVNEPGLGLGSDQIDSICVG